MQKLSYQTHSFAEFTLDLRRGCLQRGQEQIKLRPKSFEVLKYLIENNGRLISKDELIHAVWIDTAVTDDSLVQCLKDIRHALRDEAQQIIKTVPRRGYIFDKEVTNNGAIAPVTTYSEETTGVQVIIEEEEASRRDAIAASPRQAKIGDLIAAINQHRWTVVLVVLTLAVAAAASIYFTRPGEAIDSVAVMPFVNVSGDPNMEYLSDGLSDSIINNLSQLPSLKKVIALNSVLRYKGKQTDPQVIGRELNVRAVLIGRLVQRGDDLSISIELVDVRDNKHLWGGQYDRKLSDFLSVQGEITREVTEKLRLRLSGEEKRRLTQAHTENPEAYQLYLKGQYFWNKRTKEALEKSKGYFQQAIALDPNYAQAYGGLAGVYGVMGGLNMLPPQEAFEKSKQGLAKALELDDNLAGAHYGMAVIKTLYEWDWAGAEREFKRAAELNPKVASNHGLYSYYLTMGRLPEAVAEAKRVLALDPLSLSFKRDLAETLYCARQYDEAIAQCLQIIEMDPNYPMSRLYLGRAYEQKRMYEEAIAALKESVDKTRGNPAHIGSLGYVYAVSGRRDEAHKLLKQLQELSKQSYVPATSMAMIYTGLGEKDRAFEMLQKAYEERDVGLVDLYLKASPFWDSLRSDARFAELLRRMGLAP